MNSTQHKTVIWPPVASDDWPETEKALLAELSPESLPRHVAVIMDGNGRWSKQRGFIDRIRGHEAGIEAVREITRTAAMLGIADLTLYAFSKENWQRPRHEIAALMHLLERFAVEERDELMENDIRLEAIGDLADLPASVRREILKTGELTRGNTGTTLTLALSYGGRDDVIRAVRRIATEVAAGNIDPMEIDEEYLARYMDTANKPDPDLLVRTGGEFRISNFLLWQIAYTELYVTPVMWPDFRRVHLLEALVEYGRRERRYGGLGDLDTPRTPRPPRS